MIAAREAALLTLYDVFKNQAYVNLALKERLVKCKAMPGADKALTTMLVYGVVSRHYTLEYIIKKYSSVKIKKIADYVRFILELGLYQLLYTDKIPESAAVNESVKLAKKYCRKGSDRFVNAILRSFLRDNKQIEYPKDEISCLSVKYSFNPDMVKLFIENFTAKRAEIIMEKLNEPAPLCIRVNSLKTNTKSFIKMLSEQGLVCEVCEGNLICSHGFDIAKSKLYKDGLFSVQDRAAYHAAIELMPKPGETVIDMCAAPGGKTTHIAELQNDSGKIIACDIHEHKLKLIEDAAARLGMKSIEVRLCDGSKTDESLLKIADRVLCDVPCSGLGIIRRKPDIKLCRNSIEALPELQFTILNNGAKYVKNNGVLLYSTCTINKKENEEVVERFLEENNSFEKEYEKLFCPDTDNSDGFYICRLKRKN